MKLNKHNKKGMTLTECIIAIALLGAMSAMLVSIAVAAKRQNRDNYLRSAEMYEQAKEIEEFNPDATYSAKKTKVKVLRSKVSGSTGNEFDLVADFGTYKLDTKTYGYQALPTGKDSNYSNYTLKALKSEYAAVQMVPNPASGEYVVKIYNYGGQQVLVRMSVPDAGGGIFYNSDGQSISGNPMRTIIDGAIDEVGFKASTNNTLFTLTNDNNGLELCAPITKDNLDYWAEKDDKGYKTGYIPIYIYNDGESISAYSQSEYEDLAS